MSDYYLGVFAGLLAWFGVSILLTLWSLGETVTVDSKTVAVKLITLLLALVGYVYFL